MTNKHVQVYLQDCLWILALGNVLFIRVWSEWLQGIVESGWQDSQLGGLLALAVNITLFSAICLMFASLDRASSSSRDHLAVNFLLLLTAPFALNEVGSFYHLLSLEKLMTRLGASTLLIVGLILGLALLAIAAGYLLISHFWLIIKIYHWTVVTLLAVTAATLGYQLLTQYQMRVQPVIVQTQARHVPHVVWLLFDELDGNLTYDERPASVQLAEFDRFKKECWYASQAYSPAKYTMISIPCLISGSLYDSQEQAFRVYDDLLSFGKQKQIAVWRGQHNIFTDAASRGFTSEAVAWQEDYPEFLKVGLSLQQRMAEQWKMIIRNFPLVRYGWFIEAPAWFGRTQPYHVNTYLHTMRAAKQALDRPGNDLVFVHLPVPHPPGIYNRRTAEFSIDPHSSYLDNLVLADRTFGELRSYMEQNHWWDSSTIIVSSDHWWRADQWNASPHWTDEEQQAAHDRNSQTVYPIPLWIKLPYQDQGVVYAKPLNTLLTRDLILSLLTGEISDSSALSDWIDQYIASHPITQQ